MTKQTAREKWVAAISQLKEIERLACIDVANAALGEPTNKIEADRQYETGRKIVFDIPDVDMRRRAIRASRECHRLCYESGQEELQEIQLRISDNGDRRRRNALLGAVIMGIGAILLGNYYWHLLGATVAAVPALLIGFDSIRRADRAAISDIEVAQQELHEQEAYLSKLGTDGWYSKTEEETGLPNY